MTYAQARTSSVDHATAALIASGVVALAVALGVGRFAFTPLMPLMIRDGTLSASVGAEWAAANYMGTFSALCRRLGSRAIPAAGCC